MNTRRIRVAALVLAAGLSGTAQATLYDRGGGLIYDSDLNVTWLQDANYAQTSGYDADGMMTWSQAVTWAANLTYYDSVRNVTYDDWRLPTIIDTGAPGAQCTFSGTDCGYNVDTASSEMAYLFYVDLGNKAYFTTSGAYPQTGWGLVNKGPFINLHADLSWSGTSGIIYSQPDENSAWNFDFNYGRQFYQLKTGFGFAIAVRPGDVAAVPEPEAYAMMLAGLGLVGWAARRRQLAV